jgi:hypothetical protein
MFALFPLRSQVITGNFLADFKGNWITDTQFSYILNSYSVNLLSLQYTYADWANVMRNITAQVTMTRSFLVLILISLIP